MKQSKEWGANVKVGFNGQGKTRVGEDCVEAQDIVVGGEVQLEAMRKGGGDDQGCDGEFSRGGGGGGSRIGVSKSRGEFDGHVGGEGRFARGISNERDEGSEVSFYTPGGVPWHGRILIRGARSLLLWNILSNEPSTVGGAEFLCVLQFSQSRSVPHVREVQGVETGSSSRRRGSRDRVIGEKHGTCRECSRTVGGGVCM